MPDPKRNPAVQALSGSDPQHHHPGQLGAQAKFTCVCTGFAFGIAQPEAGPMFLMNAQFPVGEAELIWPLEATEKVIQAMQETYTEAKTGLSVARPKLVTP